ncbi:MAG: DUF4032 domain-containing protein [Trueperaceae bacterium]
MNYANLRARRDAERIRNRAFWNQFLSKLRGVPNDLLAFEEIKQLYPSAESYAGVKSIAIEHIVGSVDRYKDFDHFFLPKAGLPLDRWVRVREAKIEGVELPAISAYKIGEMYFVKDGHHRVSVARDEGQSFIDAEIIELKVPIHLQPGDSMKALIIRSENARFLDITKLAILRPDYEPIRFSVTGRYDLLLEHIRTHQYFLGSQYHREFTWEESVMSWYDTIFTPMMKEIRRYRVLRRFPGRTEADLYLWVMDHRHFLHQELGEDLGTERATQDYLEHFSPPWWERAWLRLRRTWWKETV